MLEFAGKMAYYRTIIHHRERAMGFSAPGTETRDDSRFRSHLSMIVSRMVKFDHRVFQVG